MGVGREQSGVGRYFCKRSFRGRHYRRRDYLAPKHSGVSSRATRLRGNELDHSGASERAVEIRDDRLLASPEMVGCAHP